MQDSGDPGFVIQVISDSHFRTIHCHKIPSKGEQLSVADGIESRFMQKMLQKIRARAIRRHDEIGAWIDSLRSPTHMFHIVRVIVLESLTLKIWFSVQRDFNCYDRLTAVYVFGQAAGVDFPNLPSS
ncbi:hypothetical protein N9O24_00530 [bacterium]|nr:hypothetical protein [bacterium]